MALPKGINGDTVKWAIVLLAAAGGLGTTASHFGTDPAECRETHVRAAQNATAISNISGRIDRLEANMDNRFDRIEVQIARSLERHRGP